MGLKDLKKGRLNVVQIGSPLNSPTGQGIQPNILRAFAVSDTAHSWFPSLADVCYLHFLLEETEAQFQGQDGRLGDSQEAMQNPGKAEGHGHGAGPEGTGTGRVQKAELAGCSESVEILTPSPPPLWPGGCGGGRC